MFMKNNSVPFSRGVNFSKWFEFRSVEEIQFDRFVEQDFINVKSMGADVIRVPIAVHNFTKGAPEHIIDPVLINYLDSAVDWAEKHEIYIILDNHSFHPVNPTDVNIDKILIPVWTQLARHFKDRGNYVIYEVLNEPHHIADERWGEIQGMAIDAIRKIDQKHTIIVGGTDYNSIAKLTPIPEYTDTNLIYTFHFYDPHIFTHQGATWNKPSLVPLSGLPFPLGDNELPPVHETFKGTWVEDSLNGYKDDSEYKKLSQTLERAAAFSKEQDVPVFCGEFGVFMIQSPQADRVKWYEFICGELTRLNFSWTCWDYFGGFGIFKTQWRGEFPADLDIDIVNAMGFKV
jgi:endoglucanase